MCEDKASYLAVASLWHNCAPLAQPLCANRSEASKQLRPGLVSDSLEAPKWTKQTLISLSLYLTRPLLHREKEREGGRERKRELNELEKKRQAILTKCVKYEDARTSSSAHIPRHWHMPFAKRKKAKEMREDGQLWGKIREEIAGWNLSNRHSLQFTLSNNPWLSD